MVVTSIASRTVASLSPTGTPATSWSSHGVAPIVGTSLDIALNAPVSGVVTHRGARW